MKTRTFNIGVSERTRRDWETVKESTRDLVDEFRDWRHLAIYIVASFVLAAIIAAPWLSDNSEWAWK